MKKLTAALLIVLLLSAMSSCSDRNADITVKSRLDELGYTSESSEETETSDEAEASSSEEGGSLTVYDLFSDDSQTVTRSSRPAASVESDAADNSAETAEENTEAVQASSESEVSETETAAAETETTSAADDTDKTEITYVLNRNSKKFHKPTCSSVKDIKDKNREDSSLSREELIEQGYSPCGRCNP